MDKSFYYLTNKPINGKVPFYSTALFHGYANDSRSSSKLSDCNIFLSNSISLVVGPLFPDVFYPYDSKSLIVSQLVKDKLKNINAGLSFANAHISTVKDVPFDHFTNAIHESAQYRKYSRSHWRGHLLDYYKDCNASICNNEYFAVSSADYFSLVNSRSNLKKYDIYGDDSKHRMLSNEFVSEYGIIDSVGLLISEKVFGILCQHLEPDYFYIKQIMF
jgi:hypothetical protein